MRTCKDILAFYDQVEFFVDAVSGYGADFALFPEFFNTPLIEPYNHMPTTEAMRELANMTAEIQQHIQQLAVSYNVNIIAGTMPVVEDDGRLYNVSLLCQRNGQTEERTEERRVGKECVGTCRYRGWRKQRKNT